MGEPSSYPLARAHTVGILGRCAAVTGALVLVAVVTALLADLPGAVGAGLLAVLSVPVALTAVAAVLVVWPPAVLRLTDTGYRVRVLRGAGAGRANWSDVHRVRRERLAAGTCVVVWLTGGGRTVVPVHVLEGGAAVADRLEADLRTRLDRSHGQRRLTDGQGGGGGGI